MMSGVDIAAIIIAGGLVAGGAWDRVKRLGTDRRDERARLANGPEPVCGCGHHLAYHDLHDGRCYAEVKREANGGGGDGEEPAAEVSWHQCACRRYAGPEPLATLYAPPLARAGYQQPEPKPVDAPGPADEIEAEKPEG